MIYTVSVFAAWKMEGTFDVTITSVRFPVLLLICFWRCVLRNSRVLDLPEHVKFLVGCLV